MRMKWLAPSIALSAVLFGALQIRAQVLFGPNSKGGFNAYTRDATNKPFAEAEADAQVGFPGYKVGGVDVLPADSKIIGHLVTLQGKAENDFVLNNVGTGWLGLTDDPEYGGEEFGNTSGMPYPAFKDGTKTLRNVPVEGERGAGWVWVTGEPFEWNVWNGGEPNDCCGGENYAELIGTGTYNDLSTQSIPSLIEWELNLPNHPITLDTNLAVEGGKLVGRVVGTTTAGGTPLTGETWSIAQRIQYTLKPNGATTANQTGGMKSTWLNGNLTSDGAWDDALANPDARIVEPFFLDRISYGGNTPNGYPAFTGITGNRENYSVQWEGEIFIPQGTVTFWDGNDDYTKLVIDGETLIEDNNWTSWSGADNNNTASASFSATKSNVTLTVDGKDFKGGWYPIQFRGAEGGGGDNFRLVWDVGDFGNTGPDKGAAYANPNADPDTYFTVGAPFYRTTEAGVIVPGAFVNAEVPLGLGGANPLGYAGNDGFGSAGTNVAVPFGGEGSVNLSGNVTLVLRSSLGGLSKEDVFNVSFGGGPSQPGDVNGDGKVDLTDFNLVKENFGKGGGAAVPEPSSLALLGLGSLCGLFALARRRLRKA